MREGKINKWVNDLLNLKRYSRHFDHFPRGFYKELTKEEQAEVVRRYKDRAREQKPFNETK